MPAAVAFGIAVLELLLTRFELELLEDLELSELEELIWLELELTELELTRLAVALLIAIGGAFDLVPPLPPPQAVKVKLKRLAMKTGLINLIIVSGVQTTALFIMLLELCCNRFL